MTELSKKILADYQVRKTKRQKETFRRWLCAELEGLGYTPREETGNLSTNVVVGDPDSAAVIYTAHYDTCPVLPVPNFITPRNLLWYLLYQLLLVAPMFLLAIGGEIALLLAWESVFGVECPMWLAVGVVYLVMGFFVWAIMFGPANKHTANDNTSGVITLLEIAQALPEALRDRVCLVFFDNEEKGLLGSSAFAAAHGDVKKNTLLVNFDCVSDGDYIQFYPSRALKRDYDTVAALEWAFVPGGKKEVEVVTGFGFYPSDQAQFKRGVGVCALKKSRLFGYYMNYIHTKKDIVLEAENIRLLCAGAVRLARKYAAGDLEKS